MLTLFAPGPVGRTAPARPANVAPTVWSEIQNGRQAPFLVMLQEQADLSGAAGISGHTERVRFVVQKLRETARTTQPGLRALLDQRDISYQSFYVANMIAVTGDQDLVMDLIRRPEVARIEANSQVQGSFPKPLPITTVLAPLAIEWGVQRVNADDVWGLGYTGQGVVVAGQDTGYDWDHPALKDAYRGWDGATVDHDYNWHDAIHSGGGSCGIDSPIPCDDHSHGTHTMGTIVGSGGIGVAPGARWIGCRNMSVGVGTPATYSECFEFFLAPYPVGGDASQGDPAKAPHVINNSWVCPNYEGCAWSTLQTIVENVRTAGILVVASAGNEGSGCSSVYDPPALYDAAFSVGATDSSDNIAGFSSRGPVTVDGSGRRKPDVSAPGVSVYSSLPGGGYGYNSGTSMAGPHVAGTAALLWSASPCFLGNVDGTEQIIEQTARPRTTSQGCGGDSTTAVPNNVYGWGIVDALAAVEQAQSSLAVSKRATLPWSLPAQQLVYDLVVTNTTGLTYTNVVLTDTLPTGVPLAWASGVYTETSGLVSWEPVTLTGCARLTATLAITISHLPQGSTVVNEQYGIRASELVTPVMGSPVETVIPWRVMLLYILREWSE